MTADPSRKPQASRANLTLRIGFLMNPYAGIGGPAGFKGSDLAELQDAAASGNVTLRAPERAETFWRTLEQQLAKQPDATLGYRVVCAPKQMGAHWLAAWGIAHHTVDVVVAAQTTAQDTQQAALAIMQKGVDILVFVGGDGTARDIFTAVGSEQLVLGVPSGVKMHSGVYAINPQCASELIVKLLTGQLIAPSLQEVRDIDEDAFRQGRVKAQFFGEMPVPAAADYVQAVKQGGIENEALVIFDIAEYLRELLPADALVIWAPGSTTLALLSEWGFDGTLLGVDVLTPEGDLVCDVNAEQLNALAAQHPGPIELVLTAIGGQGHIIGRGNQQITAALLERIGRSHVHVVASKAKLQSLNGRPLLLDSGCAQLDKTWAGLIPVHTGFDNPVLYPVGLSLEGDSKTLVSHEASKLKPKLSPNPALNPKPNSNSTCSIVTEPLHPQFIARIQQAFNDLSDQSAGIGINSRRVFHGRSQLYEDWAWCTVDIFAPLVLLTVFSTPKAAQLNAAVRFIKERLPYVLTAFAVQRRDLKDAPYEWHQGNADLLMVEAYRNGQRYKLDFNQQNCGYFLDMEPGRVWLEALIKRLEVKPQDLSESNCVPVKSNRVPVSGGSGPKVLNLFAYTCAFSVVAIAAGASRVVNVDLSRRSLTVGRENHRLNGHDTSRVDFLGVDILKSWGKIKKHGPYDAVIVDPPSFQRGSFVATKDYQKVVRRLPELLAQNGEVLACLNAPEFSSDYLKALFAQQAPNLTFTKRLTPSPDFPDIDSEQQLKLLVYRNGSLSHNG